MELTEDQRRWLHELFTHVHRGSSDETPVINRGVEPNVTSIRGHG